MLSLRGSSNRWLRVDITAYQRAQEERGNASLPSSRKGRRVIDRHDARYQGSTSPWINIFHARSCPRTSSYPSRRITVLLSILPLPSPTLLLSPRQFLTVTRGFAPSTPPREYKEHRPFLFRPHCSANFNYARGPGAGGTRFNSTIGRDWKLESIVGEGRGILILPPCVATEF